MPIEVQKRDGGPERQVAAGCCVSTPVLGAVAARWEPGLFPSRWANLVVGWAVKHYRKYGVAPGAAVSSYFDEWSEAGRDPDIVGLVEQFLVALSDEAERLARTASPDHLIDLAGRVFNRHRADQLRRAIEADLDGGDSDKALARIDEFRKLELGTGAGVRVMKEPEAIDHAFAARGKALVEYPDALGEFFKTALARDSFVAWQGREKIGKCVDGRTLVSLADGRVISIRKLVETRDPTPVLAYDEKSQKIVPVKVSDFWDNGEKECWRVTTRTGRSVSTTANHQYLTPDGWKRLEEIRPGDYVAVPKRIDYFGDKSLGTDFVKFLAYMLAEGGVTQSQATFTNTDPEMIADFHAACDGLGIKHRRKGMSTYLAGWGDMRRKYPRAFWKVTSKTKLIPAELFTCPKSEVALFLRVFFSCDGYVSKDSTKIGVTLANRPMVRQISHLLNRFGIVHRVSFRWAKSGGKSFPAWRLAILDAESCATFLREINFLSYKKRFVPEADLGKSFLDKFPWQVAERLCEEIRKDADQVVIPRPPKPGKGYGVRPGQTYREWFGGKEKTAFLSLQIREKQPLMRKSFRGLEDKSEAARRYLNSDVLWDQVESVEPAGNVQTYDIAVPVHHNFVANDFVVHNSYWLLDVAYRAVCQERNVAYFECGDLSQAQVLRRFAVRAAGRPLDGDVGHYPAEFDPLPDGKTQVRTRREEFDGPLTADEANVALRRLAKKVGGDRLVVSCHPNSTLTVAAADQTLDGWERDGWAADLVIFDYADILAPPDKKLDRRDQINETWKAMRALSQKRHCLVLTATQADADSYNATTQTLQNFSEDKRKYAHVTGMVGINQTEAEKGNGVYRLNWLVLRELEFDPKHCVYIAGNLAYANPAVLSAFG